jgi:dUTP pyrophosphatase
VSLAQPLKFLVGPGGKLPTRTYPDDAGFDLYISESVTVPVGGYADVPTGVSCELPAGVWALITGRSSTIRNRRLLVVNAIIDTGWRGELFSAVQNVGLATVRLEPGERIAQMILMCNRTEEYTPICVEQLDPHAHGRNRSGFGSSGR